MKEARDQVFTLRIGDGERAMLDALAERQGLTASDVVRTLVRREHARIVSAERRESPDKGRAR